MRNEMMHRPVVKEELLILCVPSKKNYRVS